MKYLFFIVLLFICFSVKAQQSTRATRDTTIPGKLNTALKNYSSTGADGKIFLQFDRQQYNPGDTVWFKAYNLLDDGLPDQEHVLYTELINSKDSIVSRITLKLDPAITWGDIPISDDLNPAAYRVRAYLKSSSGNLAANYFERPLNIGVRIADDPKGQMPVNAKFYPEGGTFTTGLRSKIAIKIVDSYGRGATVSGVITDDENSELASFTTSHGGIGVFALTPIVGKKYKALVTTVTGRKLIFDLPPAVPAGFSLTINNQLNDSVYIKIAANAQLLNVQAKKSFYVIGQRGGDIFYTAKGDLKDAVMTMHMAKNQLPSGILQFTVFNDLGRPLNSRMIFNQDTDTLNMVINNQPRQPLNIEVKDAKGMPVSGSFAVAVTAESVTMPDIADNDLLAYMQLTGELKDRVEDPEYYFAKQNKGAKAAMDMLLITQQNKRYNWQDILSQTVDNKRADVESGLSFEGFIKDKKNKPLPGARVMVFCLAQHFERDTLADVNGHFKFDDLDVADTASLVVKATSSITTKMNIYVKDNNTYPSVNKTESGYVSPNGTELIDDDTRTIAEAKLTADTMKVYNRLKQVDITATKAEKESFLNNYGSTPTYTIPGSSLLDNGPNLAFTLSKKIPGAIYSHGVVATKPSIMSVVLLYVIVIDGHVIPSDQLVNYVGPEDVENVKLLEGITPHIPGLDYGLDANRPVLLITTKRFAGTAPPEGRDHKTVEIATDTSGRSMIVTTQPKKILKQVNIKSAKIVRNDASNDYGASLPYTINGDVFRELGGSVKDGLLTKVPRVFVGNDGKIGYLPRAAKSSGLVPIHIVINNREVARDEIDMNVSADEIEDVRVLHGAQYKTTYGIPVNESLKDEDDIFLITTKRFAGTAKPEAKQMKTVTLTGADTSRKTLFTANTKKPKILKDVNVKATKDDPTDFAPNAYTLKGDKLKDLGASLTRALAMKLPNVKVMYDRDQAVDYFASFTSTPGTIDNSNPVYPRLHVVINNAELSPSLGLDSYLSPDDVQEVKVLHGAIYKSRFSIAIDPKQYDMDDIIYIKTKPGAGSNHIALLKKQSQIQNESYVTTADPSSILTYKFAGYSTVHEFSQAITQLYDSQRTKTIFWQPNLITDTDGKLTIKLNDKQKGTYRVTVQGIDSYGRTGRLVYTYKEE